MDFSSYMFNLILQSASKMGCPKTYSFETSPFSVGAVYVSEGAGAPCLIALLICCLRMQDKKQV